MKISLFSGSLHEELLRSAIQNIDSSEMALSWMTLLHTHQIHLKKPIVVDAPGIVTFSAVTQRQAATIIGNLWKNRRDKTKTEPIYWYHLWNEKHAYETLEDIPADVRMQIVRMRELLAQDVRILSIEPDI